jgi:hypothetical protein
MNLSTVPDSWLARNVTLPDGWAGISFGRVMIHGEPYQLEARHGERATLKAISDGWC